MRPGIGICNQIIDKYQHPCFEIVAHQVLQEVRISVIRVHLMKGMYSIWVVDIPNGNDIAMDHVEALLKLLFCEVRA
jgi:hypothetical protein